MDRVGLSGSAAIRASGFPRRKPFSSFNARCILKVNASARSERSAIGYRLAWCAKP